MVHEPLTEQFLGVELTTDDPSDVWTRLRAKGMTWNDHQGFWVASRYADVMQVSTDSATFCSAQGILTFEIGAEYATPPTMMHTDAPDHSRYRSLAQPAFGRRVVKDLDDSVRAAAKALVDALPLDEPVDVVADLAARLPVQVIAQLLGLPEEQWSKVWAWSEASIPGTETSSDPERQQALNSEMKSTLMSLVAVARTQPGIGVISQLAAAEIEGDRLNDDEISMFLTQLLVAGNETARNTISGGLVALAQNPEQWTRLVEDRSLLPSAVEEILRWTTAVIYFMRTATTDVVVGGQLVAAGDPVVMIYASANRDEAEFGPTAGSFVVDRSPNHHVAFGFGAHFCLGAALARLEVAAVLDAMLDRGVTGLELAGPVGRSRSNIIAGTTTAPLILRTH